MSFSEPPTAPGQTMPWCPSSSGWALGQDISVQYLEAWTGKLVKGKDFQGLHRECDSSLKSSKSWESSSSHSGNLCSSHTWDGEEGFEMWDGSSPRSTDLSGTTKMSHHQIQGVDLCQIRCWEEIFSLAGFAGTTITATTIIIIIISIFIITTTLLLFYLA